ncbi:MAG TPA: hypothetical protein VGD84_13860, partial [Pseudonocardiaceae bacterium]
MSFVEFAQVYVDMKWPDAAAKTRMSTVDALATAAVALTREAPGKPTDVEIRRLLVAHLLPPATRDGALSTEDAAIASWICQHSRPLYDLVDAAAV